MRKLDFYRFGLFLKSSATDIVLATLPSTAAETATAQHTSHCTMARGHRLNTSTVLAAVHGLSGLFRAVSAVEPFTLSPPSHSVPVPNRPTRLCGRKATLNQSDSGALHIPTPGKSVVTARNYSQNWPSGLPQIAVRPDHRDSSNLYTSKNHADSFLDGYMF